MEEAVASLILSLLPGLTHRQAIAVLNYYGTAEAALADTASPSKGWDVHLRNRTSIQAARERALKELEYCDKHQVRVIPYSSDDYPQLLKAQEIGDPPLALFYRGTSALERRHVLSVVGTRHITPYGKQFCESFFAELARLRPDCLVVSGLAYGVDIHAHRAALENGLETMAVLAHGHDRIYPRMHTTTAEEMTLHGGLLTEYMTGTNPDKGNFVRRNRIVAGISAATLVVESAERGGSLITATLAHSYGREVMAVPGRVNDPYSAGCNRYIRENKAALVTSAADVVSLLGWKSAEIAIGNSPQEQQLFPTYTAEQEKVLNAFESSDSLSLDQLAAQTGFNVTQISSLLFDLEDLGAVCRLPGNRFRLHG